jgi:serine/threonine protein kinase
VRHILGAWLIEREYRIYQQLEGCPGVPRLYGRPDRWSFVVEYIDGRSLERRDPELQDPAFFCRLRRLIEAIHARGIVHLDLRHKGNIMISQDGTPYIIDFNSGIYLGGNPLGRRLLPWFKKVDWAGLLKLKQRVAPELLSAEELSRLKWFGFIRKFWIFN